MNYSLLCLLHTFLAINIGKEAEILEDSVAFVYDLNSLKSIIFTKIYCLKALGGGAEPKNKDRRIF